MQLCYRSAMHVCSKGSRFDQQLLKLLQTVCRYDSGCRCTLCQLPLLPHLQPLQAPQRAPQHEPRNSKKTANHAVVLPLSSNQRINGSARQLRGSTGRNVVQRVQREGDVTAQCTLNLCLCKHAVLLFHYSSARCNKTKQMHGLLAYSDLHTLAYRTPTLYNFK